MFSNKQHKVSKHYYERFIATMQSNLSKEQETLENYLLSKEYLVNEVKEEYVSGSKKVCDINFDSLKVKTDFQFVGRSKDLNPLLKNIAKINSLIKETNQRIAYYSACSKIQPDEHNLILSIYNDKINDAILLQGYSYNLGNGLSNIRIRLVGIAEIFKDGSLNGLAINKRTDWGSSYKKKREILARGGVPLLEDNGGEPWLVYDTRNNRAFYRWKPTDLDIPNIVLYSFNPSKPNASRLNTLSNDPAVTALYDSELSNKNNSR